MTAVPPLPAPVIETIDGVEIATYHLGPEGPHSAGDVVLCHGTPWSAAVWTPVARVLAREHRVHLWDMPGYGASIRSGGAAVDLVSQRRRLASLLETWQLPRPHVIAHDIGGAVALGAHLLDGSEYVSLHLVDVVTLDPWGSPFFRLVAQHEQVFAALPPALHAALVREYIAGAGGEALTAPQIDALTEPWRSPAGQAAFYRQIAQLSPQHTAPIVERLDQVRCPVRVSWGEEDPWIPVEQAAELAARLPGHVEVRTYAGAGHLVPLEAADALGRDARDWLHGSTR